MAFTVDPSKFRFPAAFAEGVRGKRVLISGAGKDGSMGQGFALAAGLNGAACVGVHFHSSYNDGLDLVDYLRSQGVEAFPVQADVTNMGDLWATRTYIMEKMGGAPNLVICNSGLTEKGYSFGRALREVEGESRAMRRARVRQAFISNLVESRDVLDTKIDGFLAMTHLWSGEAVYANEPLQIVYISSRQAIDPGVSVPGYAIANWAVLQLPKVLEANLGKASSLVSAFSVMYPFVRTGMTGEYAENPKVFGRWQPRMLETHEAAHSFLQVLARPADELRNGMFEVMVDPAPNGAEGEVVVTWKEVKFDVQETPATWSAAAPLSFKA
ncbi:MAG: SDR family NAD(P)-dependent oxidoreductase [Dehalococcoidia bacterium]|nr:MAG: SDR family NAD(P)-dependent oxidoreductase [bacterium]MCE7929457.1 SDR family NAD(P)-dependent oxidoreductase [Chloroflexi bacterium CFX7]MCK6564661.1 SDR family NAD(P)-dependent oxidoreductase [Dehalococcoidia bacterium]MCL4230049.1 SDR family NAD(P)-dependent oxidoreductase [Dehalococcoidia bacterium]NUQ55407.1 SDR family NAD(P)-dependent oxidoreductase [Dehalococcoidia bacterium]